MSRGKLMQPRRLTWVALLQQRDAARRLRAGCGGAGEFTVPAESHGREGKLQYEVQFG